MIKFIKTVFGDIKLIILSGIFLTLLIWINEFRQLKFTRQTSISQAIQRNSNLTLALENYTIRTIQKGDLLLQILRSETEKNQYSIINYHVLKNAIEDDMYKVVTLSDEHENLIYSNIGKLPDTLLKLQERNIFRSHLKSSRDELMISKPVMSLYNNIPVIIISRRILKSNGQFGGMIAAQIAPSAFTSFYEKADINKSDIVSLIAPDGITYARQTGSVPSSGEDISKSPLFTYVAKKPIGWYFAKDAIHNIPTYFTYRKLQKYPIIATVGTAEADVLAGFYQLRIKEIIFTSVITALIFLFCLFLCKAILNRKKFLLTLKKSEEKYRSVFENSKDAIVLFTLQGKVIAFNPSAQLLFKINAGTNTVQNFTELICIHKKNHAATDYKFLTPEFLNGEFRFKCTDHSEFTGEIASSSFYDVKGNRIIVAVIRDISERLVLQNELMIEKTNKEQAIMKNVIQAQERERELIGRELHDNICQLLATANMYIGLASKHPDRTKEYLPQANHLIKASAEEVRNLSHSLSAPTLGSRSLIDAIDDLLAHVNATTKIEFQFNHNNNAEAIDMDQKLAIFRIIQEQLNNILKHANATMVLVTLLTDTEKTALVIKDNGDGFEPELKRKGIGLNNIEARVKAFSGCISILSDNGKGCIVEVTFPVAEHLAINMK
jgi:PAS domain S-box-containing protein